MQFAPSQEVTKGNDKDLIDDCSSSKFEKVLKLCYTVWICIVGGIFIVSIDVGFVVLLSFL